MVLIVFQQYIDSSTIVPALTFLRRIHGGETPILCMALGLLHTKKQWCTSETPKIDLLLLLIQRL
jgi:hypothetical protein